MTMLLLTLMQMPIPMLMLMLMLMLCRDYISVVMDGDAVCGAHSEARTDITFDRDASDLPPVLVTNDLTVTSGGTLSLYMETTQVRGR
jgi:hypothetical protein